MTTLRGRAAAGDAEIWVRARDEGAWGDRLKAVLTFTARPLAIAASAFAASGFVFERGVAIVAGAVLRLQQPGGALSLARVSRVWEEWHPVARCRTACVVRRTDRLPVVRAELVEGEVSIDDGGGRPSGTLAWAWRPLTSAGWRE